MRLYRTAAASFGKAFSVGGSPGTLDTPFHIL